MIEEDFAVFKFNGDLQMWDRLSVYLTKEEASEYMRLSESTYRGCKLSIFMRVK